MVSLVAYEGKEIINSFNRNKIDIETAHLITEAKKADDISWVYINRHNIQPQKYVVNGNIAMCAHTAVSCQNSFCTYYRNSHSL